MVERFNKTMKRYCLTLLALLAGAVAWAQSGRTLSLDQAIELATTQSPRAKVARLSFMGRYWNFRSYQAELRPSFNLGGSLLNYDRSFVDVRDAQSGEVSYVSNHSLRNYATLSIDQNVPFLGGTLSLESYLSRLDQFNYDVVNYNANPLLLSYTQPLKSYNSLKWRRKTEPIEYEKAKRQYLETLQDITIATANLFFAVLSAQSVYEENEQNYTERRQLYQQALRRHELTGGNSRSEILQLELSLLNAEMAVTSSRLEFESDLFELGLYLGMTQLADVRLLAPDQTPDLQIEAAEVIDKARQNSTHPLTQDLKRLSSEQALAQARSVKGLQMTLNANLGFSQTADNLTGAYSDLREHEVVGISFRLPLYDWGLSEGKVRMAKADLEVALSEIELAEAEFEHDVATRVARFNNQSRQCAISLRAREIAGERYELVKHRFEAGAVTVTELNTAQSEYDSAVSRHISQMQAFWSAYYDLQKTALYDFLHRRDIVAAFDELVE